MDSSHAPEFAEADFLYEMGSLRHIKRMYPYAVPGATSSVAEHTLRVCFIALMLARKCGADELKVLKIAMSHDLPEVRTGDANPWQKPYVSHDSVGAMQDMLAGTKLEDLLPLLEDYEKRESLEAQIVKDADMIDTELELKELAEMGSQNHAYFHRDGYGQDLLARMRTKAGKTLFRQISERRPIARYGVARSSIGNKTHGT